MNRTQAIAKAMELHGSRGFFTALSEANKIPGEPNYVHRCVNCSRSVDPLQYCCGECENYPEPECPMCEDEIEWKTGVTGSGLEYRQPVCTHCDWKGDPQ